MTELDLEEIERLARAATPGDHWFADDPDDLGGGASRCAIWAAQDPYGDSSNGVITAYGGPCEADAAFIAATDPPTLLALCAEVRRLRAERERLFDVVDRVEHFTADLWYNSHNGDKYEATIRGVRGIVGGVRDLLLPQSAAHPDTEGGA